MTGAEPHTTNKNNNSLEIRERNLMSKVWNLFVRKMLKDRLRMIYTSLCVIKVQDKDKVQVKTLEHF